MTTLKNNLITSSFLSKKQSVFNEKKGKGKYNPLLLLMAETGLGIGPVQKLRTALVIIVCLLL